MRLAFTILTLMLAELEAPLEKSAAEAAPWPFSLYARYLEPSITGAELGSWPVAVGAIDPTDPHDALVARCRILKPGHELSFPPDVVMAAYGPPGRAYFLLASELGDDAGKRYRIRVTYAGALIVSVAGPSVAEGSDPAWAAKPLPPTGAGTLTRSLMAPADA